MSTISSYEENRGTSSKNVDDRDKSVRLTVDHPKTSERPISPSAFSDLSDLYGQDTTVYVGDGGAGQTSHKSYTQSEKQSFIQAFWTKNKGLVYVTLSQVFNCFMNVTITVLEVEGNDGKGYHPLQVLFVRMGITCLLASLYMWRMKIPDFPFGAKGVRWLLTLRGFGGFFGVSAMYYSLIYLPLADATVLTFLSPVIACIVCAYILKEKFTRMEQIATVISLAGVILIGRPSAIFSFFNETPNETESSTLVSSLNSTISEPTTVANHLVTSHEKVIAVGVALIGAVGGAIVITTLRSIGSRAHPLITVNYFASMVSIVSALLCILIPSIGVAVPRKWWEWGYLFFLGICGFTAQTLGGAGLQYEKSSRATNMIYTQMLFALIMDQLVFGHSPELLSIIGSALILGSAITIAFKKTTSSPSDTKRLSEGPVVMLDEEIGLMEAEAIEQAEEIAMSELRGQHRTQT